MNKTPTKLDQVVFQGKNGELRLKADHSIETIWASQADLANLYGIDQSVISRHVNKIFKDGEVSKKSNMQKMHIANSDKPVNFYSLEGKDNWADLVNPRKLNLTQKQPRSKNNNGQVQQDRICFGTKRIQKED